MQCALGLDVITAVSLGSNIASFNSIKLQSIPKFCALTS